MSLLSHFFSMVPASCGCFIRAWAKKLACWPLSVTEESRLCSGTSSRESSGSACSPFTRDSSHPDVRPSSVRLGVSHKD